MPVLSQCQQCRKTWGGLRAQHCKACHETFTGTESGDKHRTGKHDVRTGNARRRCRTPDEMLAVGLVVNPRGLWGEPPGPRWWETPGLTSPDEDSENDPVGVPVEGPRSAVGRSRRRTAPYGTSPVLPVREGVFADGYTTAPVTEVAE